MACGWVFVLFDTRDTKFQIYLNYLTALSFKNCGYYAVFLISST
jgi:hypothetical protein